MSDESKKDKKPEDEKEEATFHRRGFFTEGLRQFFKPIAEVVADNVENRLERAGVAFRDGVESSKDEPPIEPPTSEVPDRPILRPPGALPEEEFLDRCLSSGLCITSCPVTAIKFGASDDPLMDEKPFIDPETQACVVCDDLSCMAACPTGALLSQSREEINMGLAVVHDEICLRTQGEDCQICVDKCPLGRDAIEIPYEGGAVLVHEDGCTGCGVCQMYCPTEPRA
ncbi:MAG: 4Fe-4S dicluster domain-containing protein, partial [Planctomycetota bacterium]